jgi:type VI secretion system protein ImpD
MFSLRVTQLIGKIDHKKNILLNDILHHSEFQALEARWRNLHMLATHAKLHKNIKLRVLNINFKELQNDINKVIEFDQSEFFNKIYHQEFSMPGGEPFGLLIGDFYIQLHVDEEILTLKSLSDIAAFSFVPIIMSVNKKSFELNEWAEMENVTDFQAIFRQSSYTAWQAFRRSLNSRFVGLVLPRIILRTPYKHIFFKEIISHRENYLWGNPAFSFACTIIETFGKSGWFAPLDHQFKYPIQVSFGTDKKDIALKHPTEIYLTETQEANLTDEGFISLYIDHFLKIPLFFNCNSVYTSPKDNPLYITALLSYLLCACRFAHYLKILGRDKIGSYSTPNICANFLNQWLLQYIAGNTELSLAQRLQYPLRNAQVEVKPRPGLPGYFTCKIQLEPHMPLSHLRAIFELTTELEMR